MQKRRYHSGSAKRLVRSQRPKQREDRCARGRSWLTSSAARRGDRVSVSSEDDQTTITDDGFVG